MEDAGVAKLYKSSPTPCLYVAPVQNMVGRVPLIPLFLAGNSTPTIPHMFAKRKDACFPFGCADAAAVDGRRGGSGRTTSSAIPLDRSGISVHSILRPEQVQIRDLFIAYMQNMYNMTCSS